MVPEQVETDEVVESCIAQIKKEWKKSKKNHDEIKKLMAKTYEKRRSMVLKEIQPIVNVINIFPPLQNLLYVSIKEKMLFFRVRRNSLDPFKASLMLNVLLYLTT